MPTRQLDMIEFRCPHCDYVIGEIARFQSYEVKVSYWLDGILAPAASVGFDVYKCKGLDGLTFQVKYSTANRFRSKSKNYDSIQWAWHMKLPQPSPADFYILFGIDEDKSEKVFLFSRADFFTRASKAKDRYILTGSAKKKSDRKHYNYIPKIWRNLVNEPQDNLKSAVEHYYDSDSWLSRKSLPVLPSESTERDNLIFKYYKLGYTQYELAKWCGLTRSGVKSVVYRKHHASSR